MRIKILFLLILLLPSWVHAAVDCADANVQVNTFGTPVDPMTITYTRPSGSDFVGFVLGGYRLGGGAISVSSISWGAGTPTALTTAQYTDPNGGVLYRLIAPPSGANAVNVTWSGARLADGIVVFVCTGVNQSSPTHDATQSTGTGTTASVTVNNVTASDVVIACVTRDTGSGGNFTGGGSLVAIGTDNASPDEMNVGCWYQPGSAGGSVSVTWTSSEQWTIHAVAVAAASSSDTGGRAIWFP